LEESAPEQDLALDAPAAGYLLEPPDGTPQAPPQGDPERSPDTRWPLWTAPFALVGALVVAALAGLAIDVTAALLFGVRITGGELPPGLTIADTAVQEAGFVAIAVFSARLGGEAVYAWQFGLRPPGIGWRRAAGLIALLAVVFLSFSAIWGELFHPEKEKLLNTLGSNEGTLLLVLSAALTCVLAPIGEEFLFRGYIFTTLRRWRGTLPAALITGLLFGGVHVGSAPALDLVPLAALGFGLCLLYRYSGSLYPCVVAHCLNNCIAFASLEGWHWQWLPLIAAALLSIFALVRACERVGLIGPTAVLARAAA
jgi:membrane protease YdiL (CAAX protease family)